MTFITKDNGERATYAGGMVRDTENGKRRWDLIPDYVFFESVRNNKRGMVIDTYLLYKRGEYEIAYVKTLIDLVIEVEGCTVVEYWTRVAELMERGAIKYGEENWLNGKDEEVLARYKKSLNRHMKQWLMGDVEEDHAAAIAFNINGIIYTQ